MYSSTITMQYEDGANEKKKDEQQQRFQDNRPLKKTEVTALESLGEHEQPLIWFNIFGIALLHAVAFYGLFTRYNQAKFYTWCYEIFHIFVSGVGVTAGAHRLWAHRSYSAKLPLRILLATFFCMVGQTHMFKWIRDHRTHHKFTETKADPHDADRGFFFSHVGWLMMKRHPAVIEYGKKIDMSDVANDPVIQFFDKYYEINMSLLCFILPTLIPVYFWNERFDIAFFATLVRYVFMLNATFSVNSFAHMLGNKPYTNDVRAVENGWVSFFSLGEGWHNYHHAFPWDYKAAELPGTFSTNFIELMARIGWAYDLKSPSKDLIEKISQSKGDGTRSRAGKSD